MSFQILSVVIAMMYSAAAMLPAYVDESRKIVYAIVANVAMFELIVGSLLIYGVFMVSHFLLLTNVLT